MKQRTEEEKDILREIGNIGGGNALTSLSQMLGRPLELDVPVCRVLQRGEAGNMLERPDSIYAGVSMTITGTFDCVLALLLNKQFTKLIIDTLDVDGLPFDVRALTDMQKSALCEVGNIMGNSYVTALGVLLDEHIEVSVPSIAVNTGHCVLRSFLEDHATELDHLLFVDSALKTEDETLESCMLLCPTNESLDAILEKLRI